MVAQPVKVHRQQFINDFRSGLDDPALMTKHGLSESQLHNLFARLLDRSELEARNAFIQKEKDSQEWTVAVDDDESACGGPANSGASNSNEAEPGHGVPGNRIGANDLRVTGEMTSLYITLGVIGVVMLFLLHLTLGAVLILVVVVAALIKIRQGQLLGNCVRVSEQQLTHICELATEAARRLDMRLPDVFVTQDPVINAYAIGFIGRKSVVLHSATAESMTPEELKYIIGHELTHIKCGHTTWLALTSVKDHVNIPIVSDVLGLIFRSWSRKAEYTSDRGGLLSSCDLVSSVSALAKVAVGKELFQKMNIDHLLHQLHELDGDDVAKLTELFSTHPYIVRRIQALKSFYESDTYRGLNEST